MARPTPWPDLRLAGLVARLRGGLGLVAVLAVAGVLLGWRLGDVRQPIWDEAYNLTTLARIHAGRVQFASHPPLGLLLLAAGDRASGRNPPAVWTPIARTKAVAAEDMPRGFDYRGPRLASALAGVIAAGLFHLLMLALTADRGLALVLSLLVLCDPALLVQFRAAHLDAFQVAFVLAALLCAVRAMAAPQARRASAWRIGFALAIAAAGAVRAHALVLGLLVPVLVWPLLRGGAWRRAGLELLAALAAAGLVLGGSFAALLLVAPHGPDAATPAGRADLARVSHDYSAQPLVRAVPAFIEDYAAAMIADQRALSRHDANASHPWAWLSGGGAITYRWDATGGRVATLGLIPNRVGWSLATLGILAAPLLWWRRRDAVAGLLLIGWTGLMLVLVWLDHQRMMYAYHYFIPLLFAQAALARALAAFRPDERVLWAGLLAVTLFALAAWPAALHQPVSAARCRLLLPDCGPGS